MNNFGIVLQKGVKNILDPQDGEFQFATDTDEILALVNGVPKPRANGIARRYGISVGVGIPENSSGEDGDWYIETGGSKYKDYFKIGTWVERSEGILESSIFSSFSVKKDWSGFVTRDGSVKLDSIEYDSKTLTDNSIVVKHIADTALLDLQSSDVINTDGTDEMVPSYVPTLDGDVLDIKSLKNPDVLFYPPTTMPPTLGSIWNDGGQASIVNYYENWLNTGSDFYSREIFGLMRTFEGRCFISTENNSVLLEINPNDGNIIKEFSIQGSFYNFVIFNGKLMIGNSSVDDELRGFYVYNLETEILIERIEFPASLEIDYWSFDFNDEVLVTGNSKDVNGNVEAGEVILYDFSLQTYSIIPNPSEGTTNFRINAFSESILGDNFIITSVRIWDPIFNDNPSLTVKSKIYQYDFNGNLLKSQDTYYDRANNMTGNSRVDYFGNISRTENYITVSDSSKFFQKDETSEEFWSGGSTILYDKDMNFIREYHAQGNFTSEQWGWFGLGVQISEEDDTIFITSTGEYNDIDLDPNYEYQGVGTFYQFRLSDGSLIRKFLGPIKDEWVQSGYFSAVFPETRSFISGSWSPDDGFLFSCNY